MQEPASSTVAARGGGTTGYSARPSVISTGTPTQASSASSPTPARVQPVSACDGCGMPRSVATEIREGNPGALTAVASGHRLLAHMTENEPRSRLLRWVIWLATLFFVAMLFVPLVREALRRAALVPTGHF
jgi:hypothetical protein